MTSPVLLATRTDLLRLVAFLDRLLPAENHVHSCVLSALASDQSSQRVYFSGQQTACREDDYKAIICIKKETSIAEGTQRTIRDVEIPSNKRSVWIICSWTVESSALVDLYDALDDIVDWQNDDSLFYNKEENEHLVRKVVKPLYFYRMDRYAIDVSTALNLQINSLEGVYVKSLERNDAVTVFKHWDPYNTATTVEDIADEIVRLPSAGVFLRSNNQLVAWMHLHPPNGMSRLFTLEEHRRKGYADLLTRYLCKRVAQAGHSPYVLIAEGNKASERFFQHHMGLSWQGPFYIQETFDY